MATEDFEHVLKITDHIPKKKDTYMRNAIAIKERLLVTLKLLATVLNVFSSPSPISVSMPYVILFEDEAGNCSLVERGEKFLDTKIWNLPHAYRHHGPVELNAIIIRIFSTLIALSYMYKLDAAEEFLMELSSETHNCIGNYKMDNLLYHNLNY
ncbi:hypothetical protein PR048_020977 [Dryococelus australis]|uniref:Uncharacterized protein n=1 Tax=Dryococelus australis TaxID=614101 RepID=A0ABQ9GWY4_9NEOP|nr:hypothetical protein PR048_020977 [Dryococelus australis]